MKGRKWLYLVAIAIYSHLTIAWGVFGHEHINRGAVLSLPVPLQQFFYNHVDFITLESTVPDLRKYTINDSAEFPRHFINLESYDQQPLPTSITEARMAYPASFLKKNGILPWYIPEVMEKLTKAFREKRKTEILFLAADLGHYVGDAHMPLHASVNHSGVQTGQRGVHSLWESQLPEAFGETYNFYTGKAVYIADINAETWRIVRASNALAETLLLADRTTRTGLLEKDIYVMDSTGAIKLNKFKDPYFTRTYINKYHTSLKGMIEKQLRGAVAVTANLWYTAWVNAGKPVLHDLDPEGLTQKNAAQLKKELSAWRNGKLLLKSEREF